MENLRWILILAGVAILVLLYFSGRPKRTQDRPASSLDKGFTDMDAHYDPEVDFDPLLGDPPLKDQYAGFDDVHPDDMIRPGDVHPGTGYTPQSGTTHAGGGQAGPDLHNAGYPNAGHPHPGRVNPGQFPEEYEFDDVEHDIGKGTGMGAAASAAAASGLSTFSQKFEAFSERLSPKRRQRIAESEPADLDEETAGSPEYASKIVTLHVVAPTDTLLSGEHLLAVFESRGYHFGDLNIFHSMHNGATVFSVAKMIEPGFFDINDMSSFDTPGITLILQLPGPVPADVSFEVLVSEAFEIANELGANVLDDQHSTLSKQTVQHLREGIYEYMHRQKYFGTVPS